MTSIVTHNMTLFIMAEFLIPKQITIEMRMTIKEAIMFIFSFPNSYNHIGNVTPNPEKSKFKYPTHPLLTAARPMITSNDISQPMIQETISPLLFDFFFILLYFYFILFFLNLNLNLFKLFILF